MKKLMVKIKPRRLLINFCHGQNRPGLGKINLILTIEIDFSLGNEKQRQKLKQHLPPSLSSRVQLKSFIPNFSTRDGEWEVVVNR